MHDFLWENSWTYRQSVEQGIEKGIEQGIERGIREDIVILVKTRFPTLTELVKERTAHIRGEKALRQVLVAIYGADSEQSVHSYLLTLKSKKK